MTTSSAPFPFAELALALAIVGVLGWRAVTRERREYGRFKRLRSTVLRQRTYRRWLLESLGVIGGLAIVSALGGLDHWREALGSARSSAPAATALAMLATPLGAGIAIGALVAVVVGLVLPVLLIRAELDEIPALGDVRALIPRTRGEIPYGLGLALSAGVFEELLFRFGFPALVFAVVGDGLVAILISSVVFGLLHVYQGPIGVLATTALGLVLATLYVLSGSLLLPIALHALIDLRTLVLLPLRTGARSRTT